MDSIPGKVIDYINERRLPRPPVIDLDEPLQIDSLGIIRLISFMEIHCGFRVEDDDLVPKNFANLRALGALIAKHSTREKRFEI